MISVMFNELFEVVCTVLYSTLKDNCFRKLSMNYDIAM